MQIVVSGGSASNAQIGPMVWNQSANEYECNYVITKYASYSGTQTDVGATMFFTMRMLGTGQLYFTWSGVSSGAAYANGMTSTSSDIWFNCAEPDPVLPSGASQAQDNYGDVSTLLGSGVTAFGTTGNNGWEVEVNSDDLDLMTPSGSAPTSEPSSAPSTEPDDLGGPISNYGNAVLGGGLAAGDQTNVQAIIPDMDTMTSAGVDIGAVAEYITDLKTSATSLGTEDNSLTTPANINTLGVPGDPVPMDANFRNGSGVWYWISGGSDTSSDFAVTGALNMMNQFEITYPMMYQSLRIVCDVVFTIGALRLGYRLFQWALGSKNDPVVEEELT